MGAGKGNNKRVSMHNDQYDPNKHNTPEKLLNFYLGNNHHAIDIMAWPDYLERKHLDNETLANYYLGSNNNIFTEPEINYALNEMLKDVINSLEFPKNLNHPDGRFSKTPSQDLKNTLSLLRIEYKIRKWTEKNQDLDIGFYYPGDDGEERWWNTHRIDCDYNSYDIEYINGKILHNKLSSPEYYHLTPYFIIHMLLTGDEPEEEMDFPRF